MTASSRWHRIAVLAAAMATLGADRAGTVSGADRDCSSAIESVVSTSMLDGRYAAALALYECLRAKCPSLNTDVPCDDFVEYLKRLHPVARIDSAADVAQLLEVTYNAFTLIESNALYLTVGDVDTYAAWYLQRVRQLRSDVTVISLPYLMSAEYRKELIADSLFCAATGFDHFREIPVPATTADTDSARELIIAAWNGNGRRAAMYFSPTCSMVADSGLYIVDLGLVFRLTDRAEDSTAFFELLTTMRDKWRLRESSRGMPSEERAIKNTTIHYLSLAMSRAGQLMASGKTDSLNSFLEILDPVCRTNWRFNVLRFIVCQADSGFCETYLRRLREYREGHPEEAYLRDFLQGVDNK